MTPVPLDLTIYQGSTFYKPLQWQAGNPPTPVDLTGCSMRMHIREKIKSPNYLISLTTENGRIVITEPTQGKFLLQISAEDTANLNFKVGFYDLEVVSPNGFVRRLLEGTVVLSPEVTR